MTAPDAARFAAHLAGRIGTGAAAPPAVAARVDAAFGTGGYAALLAPDSADGVAAVLAECSAERWPVVPLGAGTWLPLTRGTAGPPADSPHNAARPGSAAAAAPSARPPILLSTVRLDRITEHEPADLVIGVQAGLSLERLGAALTAQRQWLPLDPPAAPDATIGAIAAGADSGPLRAGHGTPRDMALGVEIATGDGRLLRFGGRVVKNVAGYDGVRLAIGSRGRLGVITALYLRVRGAPRTERTAAIDCGPGRNGARRGAELARAIRDAVACDALELVSPGVAERIRGNAVGADSPRQRPGRTGWLLLVRLLGGAAAVTEGMERVRQIATGVADLPPDVWSALSRLEASAAATRHVSGTVTAIADNLAAVMASDPVGGAGSASDPGGGADARLCAVHAADGLIRLWRTGAGPVPDDPLQAAARPVEAVRVLTRRLRSVFDPAGVMSAGAEV